MTRFYRGPDEYANQMMKRTEQEVGVLQEKIDIAEQQVERLKLELNKLQENCPHLVTYDNDRVMDMQPTKTCRSCGFTA